jgi:hypothetical protein
MQQGSATQSTSRRGSNLTNEDRSRGGQRSAQMQQRDQYGHFIGSGKKNRELAGAGVGAENGRSGGSRGNEALAGRVMNNDEG